MKKISFDEFERLFNPIQQFLEECDNINDALKTIYPSSHVFDEHGSYLLEHYIDLLENYLELEFGWISWFVFDNDMGDNELEVSTSVGENPIFNKNIKNLNDFYDFLTF